VTFSSFAYYNSRKSSKFAGDYDFGRENNKRDAAERRTSDAGMQEGTIECAR